MSNIIPFASSDAGLPAHLADVFGGEGNIASRISINQLSYRGKVWRRVVDGEETQLTRKSPEGDTEPVPIVAVIVLDHNKKRSRAFYAGNFEEGKNVAPTCYSGDGVTPDADVKEPCAKTCATCPNAVKGSKITESGKQSTLCAPFKRVAVVPSAGAAGIAKHPALLLRLAQTSVWDKDNGENEAKGWYAWDQYLDMLRARGAKHTAAVETKIKFDLRMAYPKLLFSASRWLNADEAAAAKAKLSEAADDIATILSGANANDGVAGHPASAVPGAVADAGEVDDGADSAAEQATAKSAAEAEKAKKAAAAAKSKKAAEAKAAAEAAAKLAAEADEDGTDAWGAADEPVQDVAAKRETTKSAATPKVVEGTPAGLTDLLAGWDD